MITVMDLMIRKGLKDTRSLFMRCSRRVVFDSPMSFNLHIPHMIGITVHALMDPMRRQFHIGNGLSEIVQHMIQLQMILYVE